MRIPSLLFLLAVFFAACHKPPPANLPNSNWRVITIAPSIADNLLALGCGDYVVGVSEWCAVDEFASLPRVGNLGSPSLENIALLKPNVVLVQGRQDVLQKYCAQNNIYFKSFTTDSLSEWRNEINWLGGAFKCKDRAITLLQNFKTELAKLKNTSPFVDCLLVVSRKNNDVANLLIAADNGFLSDLLQAVGGRNVVAGSDNYIYLQEELLLELNPQVIFELHEAEKAPMDLKAWQQSFSTVAAVKNAQVHNIFRPQALMPSYQMLETARLMSEIIQQQTPVQ